MGRICYSCERRSFMKMLIVGIVGLLGWDNLKNSFAEIFNMKNLEKGENSTPKTNGAEGTKLKPPSMNQTKRKATFPWN